MPVLALLIRAISALNEGIGRLVALWVLLLTGLVVFEVFMRYALRAPTDWGLELTSYVFAAYILLGGGYTLLHRSHVAMDVFYSRMPPRLQALVDVLTAGMVFLFCWVLFQEGGQMALDALERGRRSGTDWNPPLFPILAMLPLGAALLMLQAVAKLLRDLVLVLVGKDIGDGR